MNFLIRLLKNKTSEFMTKIQNRVKEVLSNMIQQVENCEEDAQVYAEVLDDTLDYLRDEDFFGTEGQCDPRGDGRNGVQSIL